mgnify:CR=1 FL=1
MRLVVRGGVTPTRSCRAPSPRRVCRTEPHAGATGLDVANLRVERTRNGSPMCCRHKRSERSSVVSVAVSTTGLLGRYPAAHLKAFSSSRRASDAGGLWPRCEHHPHERCRTASRGSASTQACARPGTAHARPAVRTAAAACADRRSGRARSGSCCGQSADGHAAGRFPAAHSPPTALHADW